LMVLIIDDAPKHINVSCQPREKSFRHYMLVISLR